MTTIATQQGSAGLPPVGPLERAAWIVVATGAGVIAVAGFVNSFARVEVAMRPYFGALAWTVPLTVDVGILVFTALDLLMAYRDMRSWWLRYVPRGLIAVTVYLNAAGEDQMQGRVAHAVLPLIWVIAVEVAGAAVRSIFGLQAARPTLDRIRRSRWLLDPVGTARLRRRMILREETSLSAALERDLAFELAKADMRETHGWAWRWKAPRRQRLLLRRGQIAPGALPALALAETVGTAPTETTIGPARGRSPRTGGTARRRGAKTGTGATTTGAGTGPVDLTAVAEAVADQMETDGVALARRPFIAAMRDAGHPIGTDKAGPLLAWLKQRRNGHTNGHHPTEPTEPAAHVDGEALTSA